MFQAPPPHVNQKYVRKSTIARLRSGLATLLAPPQCVLCDAPGLPGPVDLCAGCLADLPRNSAGLQHAPGDCELLCCPWDFEFPVDELLRALKFRGERSHARLLGTLLARARLACDLPLPQWVVPVPLHPLRLRERGYNQAAELARFAARELALRCESRCLERVRATREQTHLGAAERATNLQRAFRARRPLAVASVALVDDVMTTGSTLAAAAGALRAAGAQRIEIWVAAQAQRRDLVQTT